MSLQKNINSVLKDKIKRGGGIIWIVNISKAMSLERTKEDLKKIKKGRKLGLFCKVKGYCGPMVEIDPHKEKMYPNGKFLFWFYQTYGLPPEFAFEEIVEIIKNNKGTTYWREFEDVS